MASKISLGPVWYAEKADIPRSWLVKAGWPGMRMVALGRHTNWLERHVKHEWAAKPKERKHIDGLAFDKMLMAAAHHMRADPECRGLYGASWYNDPHLAQISPNLMFFSQRVKSFGGMLFPVPTEETAKADALNSSQRRMIAHEKGLYIPKEYCAVIPREKLLARY